MFFLFDVLRMFLFGTLFGLLIGGAGLIGYWLATKKGDNNDG